MLHIGCEKTGTTSVQFWLHRHSERLTERGVFYSRTLGRHNNRRISFYGLEPGAQDDQLRIDGILNSEQHASVQEQIRVELADEVQAARAAGCHTFVISNEHCHSRQKTEANVRRIHSLLRPLFGKIDIVCFLRPQLDICLSRASTLSRNGGVISRRWIDADLEAAKPYYRFNDLLSRWSSVFGCENIVPVAYARTANVVAYFEDRLGVSDMKLAPQKVENGALDYRVMALVNGMNKSEALNSHADFRLKRFFVNELPVDQRLTLDRSWGQSLHERFAEINREICSAWPTIVESDLTPDWARYPETGNLDRLDMAEEFGPFLRQMLERKHQESIMERAHRLSMVCDRDMALGNYQAARAACREALELAQEASRANAYRVPMERLISRLRLNMATFGATVPPGDNPRTPPNEPSARR